MHVHIPDGYAPEAVEKDLGIHFKKLPKKDTEVVVKMLRMIADRLGRDVPTVAFPRKGLLVQEITETQRRELNSVLTPIYAQWNIEQQRQLLQRVKIQECGEPMQNLPAFLGRYRIGAVFSERPIEDACGSWAGMSRIWWLRREVCSELAKAFAALNDVGIAPRVEDCWRHEVVQEGLLVRRVIGIAREYPKWDPDIVHKVAMSFTAPAPGLAGHQAGAAVDWRMMTKDTNAFLTLGNDYPQGGAVSSLDFPYLTQAQWETRTLFMGVNNLAGFKVLYTEDWHGSRKDRGLGMDGKVTMQTALYGPIRDFDRQSGAIVPYQPEDVDRFYLTDDEKNMLIEEGRKKVRSKGQYKHTLAGLIGLLHSLRRKGKN